jgi:hypothetical protein
MLRTDREAAGIPYAVEGPNGTPSADFNALGHSYLTLGGHPSPLPTARYPTGGCRSLWEPWRNWMLFCLIHKPANAVSSTGPSCRHRHRRM